MLQITIAGFLFLIGLYSVFRISEWMGAQGKMLDTERQLREIALGKQTELERELELSRAKAHTHSMIAGIEDTTAIALDVLIGVEAEAGRLRTLIGKLHKMREGPNAYPKNLPAGKRPNGRDGFML